MSMWKDDATARIYAGPGTWDQKVARVLDLHEDGAVQAMRDNAELREDHSRAIAYEVVDVDATLLNLAGEGWRLVRTDKVEFAAASPEGGEDRG